MFNLLTLPCLDPETKKRKEKEKKEKEREKKELIKSYLFQLFLNFLLIFYM